MGGQKILYKLYDIRFFLIFFRLFYVMLRFGKEDIFKFKIKSQKIWEKNLNVIYFKLMLYILK